MERTRDICFTYFGDEPPLFQPRRGIAYLVYQLEVCPDTDRRHWQGFAQANNPKASINAWQTALRIPGAHLEPRRGTVQQAIDYCKKDSSRAEGATWHEHGQPNLRDNQGARIDLDDAADKIRAKRRWADVVNDESLFPVVCKHSGWCKAIFDNKPKQPRVAKDWYEWQAEMLAVIEGEPDSRAIYWIYDAEGNAGKTELAKYLLTNKSAVVLSGKTADILHNYDNQDIAIFDFPRQAEDFVNYAAIEKVKDGCYHSGKYEGKVVCRDFDIHVICFANFLPDESKLSADRWNIRTVSRP